MRNFRDVDPAELRLPRTRQIVDHAKLTRQISRFGRSLTGMPPLEVVEAADGVLVIMDGVTRATRAAKLAPGQLVRVEITGHFPRPCSGDAKIGDMIS